MPAIFFFTLLALFILTGVQPAAAQQVEKVYRVGVLSLGSGTRSAGSNISRLLRELRALGYVEGRNIVFEGRYAEDHPERLPALAESLVRSGIDMILAGGSGDVRVVQKATKTIPIVFQESVADPVAIGLVESFAKPGGNITGFTTMANVLAGKRLELLKESAPKLSRIAVLWSERSDAAAQWKESQKAAQPLGLQVHSMIVNRPDDFDRAFKAAVDARSEALAATRSRLINGYQKRIIELAAKYRWPAIYYREDFAANGGLMSYGADDEEPFKRVAAMIDKILKGTKPSDIPVEQSTKFEFVVNLKTAKTLNLTIPPEVLARATKIIR